MTKKELLKVRIERNQFKLQGHQNRFLVYMIFIAGLVISDVPISNGTGLLLVIIICFVIFLTLIKMFRLDNEIKNDYDDLIKILKK